MHQLDDLAINFNQLLQLRKNYCQPLHLSLILNHQGMNKSYQLLD